MIVAPVIILQQNITNVSINVITCHDINTKKKHNITHHINTKHQ